MHTVVLETPENRQQNKDNMEENSAVLAIAK
jgi:hypothetical protein